MATFNQATVARLARRVRNDTDRGRAVGTLWSDLHIDRPVGENGDADRLAFPTQRLPRQCHDLGRRHRARGLGDHLAIRIRNRAGIPVTPSALAAAGSASELSLSSRTSGSSAFAAAANCGAIDRQGPHQGAQTSSSRAAPFVPVRCAASWAPVTSTGAPVSTA